LVGWWPFNGNANDESGNGNNGTVNGATLSTDRFGQPSKAYSFDGIDDYINAGNNITIPNYTFSAWVNINQLPTNFPLASIVSKISNSFKNTELQYWQANYYQIQHGTGTSWVSLVGNQPVILNQWVFLSSTYDGAIINLYINGSLNVSIAEANFSDQMGFDTYFGARPNTQGVSSTAFFVNGQIDDIGIWNRALSACEIQDLYNAELNSLAVSGGPDQNLCEGQSTTLFGTGASTYQWSNNVQNGVGFVPVGSNSYILTGTDANGCIGTDTVNVIVNNTSSSSQTQSALDSYTWPVNGQTYTQSGTYTATIPNAAGCDSIITLNLSLSYTGIDELSPNHGKTLVKITDLNGKESPFKKNTALLFIYEDGTVERVFEVE
jgi:hypothetical protein